MSNISIGIGDQIPEILEMESIEHFLPQVSPDSYIKILSWIFTVLILISNGILIYNISKKEGKLTDLDKMMCFDTLLCLNNSITIMMMGYMGTHNQTSVCYLRYLWTMFNGFFKYWLPVGVVVYRYIFVVKHSWIDGASSKKKFINTIYFSIVMLSGLMTFTTVYFKDNWFIFLSKFIQLKSLQSKSCEI